jgi:hypothetical protein
MRDRLCSLGWRDIEVVDEGLGRTVSRLFQLQLTLSALADEFLLDLIHYPRCHLDIHRRDGRQECLHDAYIGMSSLPRFDNPGFSLTNSSQPI